MAAHVPMQFHPNPRSVLVVGAGVGNTASRFLLYDVHRLDIVDIEPRLFDIVRKNFESSWMNDKRVRLITEDGRNYISNTNDKYDVISIEVGQAFRPGISSFYTVDFYRHVRERLNQNGIVSQFIPIGFFDLAEFRSVVRTFLEVFPDSVLWYNTTELLLIGCSGGHPTLSNNRLNILSTDGPVKTDLYYSYFGGPDFYLNRREVFLAGFLCGPESLAKITANAPVYCDDLPRLEYSVAKQDHFDPVTILNFIAQNLDPLSQVLDENLNATTLSQIQLIRKLDLNDIYAVEYIRNHATNELEISNVAKLQVAVMINPYNVSLRLMLAAALNRQGQFEAAMKNVNDSYLIDPDHKVSRELGRAF